MTVSELIEELKQYPENMEVRGRVFVNCWSGNQDDTDLSYYKVSTNAPNIEVEKIVERWQPGDPRLKDKRRTVKGDEKRVLVISADQE